jgi:hypothetical protein
MDPAFGSAETLMGIFLCTAHKVVDPRNPEFAWMSTNPNRVFSPVKQEDNRRSVSLQRTRRKSSNTLNGRGETREAPIGSLAEITRR